MEDDGEPDPVVPQHAAELPAEIKNRVSHRAKAAAELLQLMRQAGW